MSTRHKGKLEFRMEMDVEFSASRRYIPSAPGRQRAGISMLRHVLSVCSQVSGMTESVRETEINREERRCQR